jgi:hypothetical protein
MGLWGTPSHRHKTWPRAFEDGRLRAEKQFEAEFARQTKIIDSQAELLDDLAKTLWSFEELVLRLGTPPGT